MYVFSLSLLPLSLYPDTRLMDFTPRLFELSSTTGEFVASELLYPARDDCTEAAPYLQSDLYSANQPGVCVCVCV